MGPLLHSLFTPFLSLSVQPWEFQTEKSLKEIFVSRVLIALLTRYQHNSNITLPILWYYTSFFFDCRHISIEKRILCSTYCSIENASKFIKFYGIRWFDFYSALVSNFSAIRKLS